jgi:hypothetical protein
VKVGPLVQRLKEDKTRNNYDATNKLFHLIKKVALNNKLGLSKEISDLYIK